MLWVDHTSLDVETSHMEILSRQVRITATTSSCSRAGHLTKDGGTFDPVIFFNKELT
jgi:hypothetical protein